MQTLEEFIMHHGSVPNAAKALGIATVTVYKNRHSGLVIDGRLYMPITPRVRRKGA